MFLCLLSFLEAYRILGCEASSTIFNVHHSNYFVFNHIIFSLRSNLPFIKSIVHRYDIIPRLQGLGPRLFYGLYSTIVITVHGIPFSVCICLCLQYTMSNMRAGLYLNHLYPHLLLWPLNAGEHLRNYYYRRSKCDAQQVKNACHISIVTIPGTYGKRE